LVRHAISHRGAPERGRRAGGARTTDRTAFLADSARVLKRLAAMPARKHAGEVAWVPPLVKGDPNEARAKVFGVRADRPGSLPAAPDTSGPTIDVRDGGEGRVRSYGVPDLRPGLGDRNRAVLGGFRGHPQPADSLLKVPVPVHLGRNYASCATRCASCGKRSRS
jgi:hypothetical protein